MKKFFSVLVVLSMACSFSAPAFATSDTWKADVSGDWNNAGSWKNGNIPGTSSVAGFNFTLTADRVVTVDADRYINVISFQNTSAYKYTLSGGNLKLEDWGTIQTFDNNGSHTDTIGSAIALQGTTATFNAGATAATSLLSISGAITGAAAGATVLKLMGANTGDNTISGAIGNGIATTVAVTKSEVGKWVLSGNNTYGGLTTISAGTLTLSGSNSGAGGVTLTAGTLNVNHANALGAIGGTLTLNGGTIDNTSGAAITNVIANPVTIGGNFTFTGTNDLDLGAGAVNVGAALRVISISNANTLTVGGVISGTGVGGVHRSGGDANGELLLSGNNVHTGKTMVTSGILTLSGNNSGASGGVTINGGILNINSATALGTNKFIINGGTIDNTSAGDITVTTDNSQDWSGSFTYTGSAHSLNLGKGGVSVLSAPRTITVGGNTLTVDGVINGVVDITKAGAGTLALNGVNIYTGQLTVENGKLSVASVNNASEDGALGNSALSVILGKTGSQTGTLEYTGGTAASTKKFTMATGGTGAFQIDTDTTNLTLSGVIDGGGGLTKTGSGTLTLTGANNYGGGTTISAGTLQLDGEGGTGTGNLVNNATLIINRTVLTDSDKIISGTGNIIKMGDENLILRGISDYTGTTTVSKGTLTLSKADSINNISGSTIINVASGAGFNTSGLSGGGITLASGQTLKGAGTVTGGITVGSGSYISPGASPGTLISAGAVTYAAGGTYVWEINNATGAQGTNWDLHDITGGLTVSATSGSKFTIGITSLTLGNVAGDAANFVKTNNYTWTIASTTDGVTDFAATKFTLDDLDFTNDITGATSDGYFGIKLSDKLLQLLYYAAVDATHFASDAKNSNEFNVGTVIDNITNPTSDMTTVINTLSTLSSSQTADALNSMLPDYSGAALQVIQSTLDQLTDAVLGHQASLRNSLTGVSTGDDMLKGIDVWAQVFGSYLHQDPRQLSQGYNATIWGTALGFDIPAMNDIRVGTCFGFAQDYVRGKDNSNRNNINSYQWTIYGEYAKDAYYIDLSGAFALNTYDASRQVAVGAINRTALADYSGQQYQLYIEGGYTFNIGQLLTNNRSRRLNVGYSVDKLNMTPVASFQYEHLYLEKYTETGANAMNLTVKAQNYDLAQTGFGVKFDYPFNTKYGQFVPELRFKWLYDWIGDAQATTSNFSGGGGSFATNGFKPAQSSWDFGAKVTMFTKNNWELATNYDFELKEDFYGHYGYVNAKYSF